MIRFATLALLLVLATADARAQDALRVAYDCQQVYGACDRDFFQTELPYVQFVRDQGDADVFVLITGEDTGGGGERYSLFFQGRQAYDGQEATLTVSVPADATQDDERRALAGRLALGLAPYVAQTSAADRISIAYAAPALAEGDEEAPEADPWNGWVYSFRASSFFNGESSFSSFNGNGGVSASRVTENWKTRIGVNGNYNRQSFESFSFVTGEDTTIVSTRESFGGDALAARSLGPNLTAGVGLDFGRNTFSNFDARFVGGPSIEYSLFPYEEATRRLITARYGVGVEAAFYADSTIFGQTEEVLPQHTLRLGADFAQPWGSVDASIDAQQYLTKPDKYDAGIGGSVNVRLARGLQMRVGGRVSYVRNQLFISAADLTPEQILTRQRAIETSFFYFGNVSLSYSFGSIFNAAVNRRFGSGGGIVIFG